jgi:hypothetical protein
MAVSRGSTLDVKTLCTPNRRGKMYRMICTVCCLSSRSVRRLRISRNEIRSLKHSWDSGKRTNMAHTESHSAFRIQRCLRVQHATTDKRDRTRCLHFTLEMRGLGDSFLARVAFCDVVSLKFIRFHLVHRDTRQLVVVAHISIDWNEYRTLQKHVHDDAVATLAEQCMQSTPYWFL